MASDPAAMIAKVKENATTFTNVAIRQVQGGYVVTGQVQYQDNDTKGIVLTENAEGVAADATTAAQNALNYLRNGSFDAAKPAVQTANGNMQALGDNGASSSPAQLQAALYSGNQANNQTAATNPPPVI